MQNNLQTALITGATQGIGFAIAEKLLHHQFNLIICARTQDDLVALQEKWQSAYPHCQVDIYAVDFAQPAEISRFCTTIAEKYTAINILVNNAGLYLPGNIKDEPEGNLEYLIQVNLLSAYHICRTCIPIMQTVANPHIFNICSIASKQAYPNGGAYSITKYALLGMSHNLRLELMSSRIKVTAIIPGAVYTRSWESAPVDKTSLMEAGDIADALWAAYNLSPQANIDEIVIRPLTGDL